MHTIKSTIVSIAAFALAATGASASVNLKVEPESGAVLAGKAQNIAVKISLAGIEPEAADFGKGIKERPAINLAIVIDRSGSMQGDRIRVAREAAIEAVNMLGERDIVSIIIFDHTAEVLVPAQSAANKDSIIRKIRSVEARGSTAIFAGVSLAQEELGKFLSKDRVNRVILLSDGQANVGPSSPDELGRLGATLRKQGVSATTIGLGLDYNEDLMTRLAGKSDGNSYFAETSRDLPRIFAAELKDTLSVVAQGVKLRVEFENGALPTEILGREGRIDGNAVILDFNQIYGGQEKFVIVRTAVPSGEPAQTRQIARARATYFNPFNERETVASAMGHIRYSADTEAVRRSADINVQKDLIVLENAIALERAIELNDAGRNREASEILNKSAIKMMNFGADNNMPKVEAAGKLNMSRAAAQSVRPITPAERKEYSTESYQEQTQQKSR
ncbi:MAG: VWA domain-containing protein [Kiritimatiellaeota bacterium]|nr:VWA domain-containing protein [Kiritimatiellota bacterium]